MEFISKINGAVNDVVWGPIMLALLIGAGLFLTVKTGFLQFKKVRLYDEKDNFRFGC